MDGSMNTFDGKKSPELSEGLSQLKEEHTPLLKKLEELKSLAELIDKDQNIEQNYADLKAQVENFKEDLEPHSEREEDVLFPLMAEHIETDSGPIAVIDYDHEKAKSSINTFLEKSKNDQQIADDMKYSAGFVMDACNILKEHFLKEENILYPSYRLENHCASSLVLCLNGQVY
jgi:iron-sulfur cluster repair protein YtfE (RIC family)